MISFQAALTNNPYQGYAYSYPHKTAYRHFNPEIPLHEAWKNESKDALFLYVHVPFCEMRCGFCNLFTMANPEQDMVTAYLSALERQAQITRDEIDNATFAQLAIGGGTPSFLTEHEIEKLFYIVENIMGASTSSIPASIEVSPKTVTEQKLQYLYHRGVDRISIGIQSFSAAENKLLGRPQRDQEVHQALSLIKAQGFKTLNIDLIYGGAGQTPGSWEQTLRQTLEYHPDEIYLYPLYVRPLTGLNKLGMSWDNFRLTLYRQGRDYLLDNGYEQVSMRMFQKRDRHLVTNGTAYCCQEDGMVGLGSGARSYTQEIHYSFEYAVGRKGVKNIIASYPDQDFARIHYGIRLSPEEQKRRYIIKSLLHGQGLDLQRYAHRFMSDPLHEFQELQVLVSADLAYLTADNALKLTAAGVELSDSIGPALYSADVSLLMNKFELQ